MVLTGKEIERMIDEGKIRIEPFDKDFQLQGMSVDLRISNRYYRYPKEIEIELEALDPKNPYLNLLETDYISDKGTIIEPKKFFITESVEYISVPENIAIFLQPKFRLAKMGIEIVNTGYIENGYEGNIEICLYNTNEFPIRIFPGMSLCHIAFIKTV